MPEVPFESYGEKDNFQRSIDGLDQNKKINNKEASETRVKIESLAWAFADKCSCTKK